MADDGDVIARALARVFGEAAMRAGDPQRSALAAQLAFLAEVASGAIVAPLDRVCFVVRAVLCTVFWEGGMDVAGSRAFWRDDPLAALLTRAKWRAAGTADLMRVRDASALLGVPATVIGRWIAADEIEWVCDGEAGLFVVRSDIERIARRREAWRRRGCGRKVADDPLRAAL